MHTTEQLNMRTLFSITAFCFFLFFTATAGGEVVDRSVAIVNNDIIALSEVNELARPHFQKAAAEVPADQLPQAMEQIRNSILKKLIDTKLLYQEAEKLNVRVTDQDVDNAVARIIESNNITKEQFLAELASIGLDEKAYREDLRGQILRSKLVNYEVRSKVIIPEERIIDYYDLHYTQQVGGGGYYILQIGISMDRSRVKRPSLTRKQAGEEIKKVRALALEGRSFTELATKYSDLPSADDGGDLGIFKEDEMAPFMRSAVIGLKPGQVSEIVETPAGYQLFSVLSNQEGKIITKVPYDSVKEEIRSKLEKEEMERRYKEWIKGIRDKAYIKIL